MRHVSVYMGQSFEGDYGTSREISCLEFVRGTASEVLVGLQLKCVTGLHPEYYMSVGLFSEGCTVYGTAFGVYSGLRLKCVLSM